MHVATYVACMHMQVTLEGLYKAASATGDPV